MENGANLRGQYYRLHAGFICCRICIDSFAGNPEKFVFDYMINAAAGLAVQWRNIKNSLVFRYAFALPTILVFAGILFFTPANIFYNTLNLTHYPSKLIYVNEHSTGTVTIHEYLYGDRMICIDNISVAGTDYMLRTTQKLQGYIPFILHPDPKRVVQIGFGSGENLPDRPGVWHPGLFGCGYLSGCI